MAKSKQEQLVIALKNNNENEVGRLYIQGVRLSDKQEESVINKWKADQGVLWAEKGEEYYWNKLYSYYKPSNYYIPPKDVPNPQSSTNVQDQSEEMKGRVFSDLCKDNEYESIKLVRELEKVIYPEQYSQSNKDLSSKTSGDTMPNDDQHN